MSGVIKDVTLQDFNPFNSWTLTSEGINQSKDIRDPFLGATAKAGTSELINEAGSWLHASKDAPDRKYLAENNGLIRFKCALLIIGTPIVMLAKSVMKLACAIFNRDCVTTKLAKIAKALLAPIAILGLELAAIYGVFSPKNGRKLYATIERGAFGTDYLLAPCFQPNPQRHLGIIKIGKTII